MNKIEQKLIEGNKLFRAKISAKAEYKALIKEQTKGQKPYALIITCSDSRVIPEEIFSTFLGELFVVRTAGNVINEGELASVEYGIAHLGIKYVLVLGHTHCGAVHAAIHNEKGEYLGCILDNIHKNIDGEIDERKATMKNALAQVKYLKGKFPTYDVLFKAGIYDIEDNSFELID